MKIFKKEKEVTELAEHFLDVAEHCVEEAEKEILGYLRGEVSGLRELAVAVSNWETKADRLRRELRDKLFSGAYMPLMRADIFGLIESMDTIPNAAESCGRFFYSEKPEVPEEFRQGFIEITQVSFGIIKPLKKAVKGFFKPKDKMDSIRHGAEGISEEESRVDDLQIALTVAIFDSTAIGLAEKIHLRRALGHIVEISDRAEDTADQLLLIAMKAIA